MSSYRWVVVIVLWSSVAHADYSYSVVGAPQAVAMSAKGETQSTMVPPLVKTQCPKGRVLITNDGWVGSAAPPPVGAVVGRDIGGTTDLPATIAALPASSPDKTQFQWLTNDHDILTLTNGNVLLLWGAHYNGTDILPATTPPRPTPGWFGHTSKNGFGPNVRRGVVVWRSVDCGATFQYVTWVDPVALDLNAGTAGDRSCGQPKPTSTPGSFVNGGVDGQFARAAGDTVYLMMPCVGDVGIPGASSYNLTTTPVGVTYVLRMKATETSFTTLGKLPKNIWRYPVVELDHGDLAFLNQNALSIATHHAADDTYGFPTSEIDAPLPAQQSGGNPVNADATCATKRGPSALESNMFNVMIAARAPASDTLILAYPANVAVGADATNSFVTYWYDRAANTFAAGAPIVPKVHGPEGFIMHVAMTGTNGGPVLLSWYDVDCTAKTMHMFGRVVLSDKEASDDFEIAMDTASAPHAIPFPPANSFMGDYKTAGGYTWKGPMKLPLQGEWHFFPMWDEVGHMSYSHVVVEKVLTWQVKSGVTRIKLVPAAKAKKATAGIRFDKRKAIPQPEGGDDD